MHENKIRYLRNVVKLAFRRTVLLELIVIGEHHDGERMLPSVDERDGFFNGLRGSHEK